MADYDPFELVADLVDACKVGDRQKVVEMLKSDDVLSVINAPNEEGETALYAACDNGHAPVVVELLKVKAIDTQIAHLGTSKTPLHIVCLKKQAECVALLLVAGADPKVKDRDGLTAREVAKGSDVFFAFNSWDAKENTKSLLALRKKFPSVAEISKEIAALEDPNENEVKAKLGLNLGGSAGLGDKSRSRGLTVNLTPRLNMPSFSTKRKASTPRDPLVMIFDNLVAQSNLFLEKTTIGGFPTTNNLVQNIAGDNDDMKRTIANHAQGVRILLHKDVRSIILAFLEIKSEHGTPKEKELYEGLRWGDFVRRLIIKRPLAFFTKDNMTLLRNGQIPSAKDWNLVGTDKELKITIAEYMTFDEMQISALIGVSVPTYFINCGSRTNAAKLEDGYPVEGVFVGLVGARFEQKEYMESQHMLIMEELTTEENGYGPDADPRNPKTLMSRSWAKFYGQKGKKKGEFYFPTYKAVEELYNSDQKKAERFRRYKPTGSNKWVYFNIEVYKKRISYSIVNFLSDANARAGDAEKEAYCSVVGLGLGAWQVLADQGLWMLESYEKIIAENPYHHIGKINFKWFSSDIISIDKYRDKTHIKCEVTGKKIEIEFSKQELIPILDGPYKDMLHVAMYAWDGNSYPGNEYWQKLLAASGDPAAACCSTIPQLQNPEINPYLISNPLWVAGEDDSGETQSTSSEPPLPSFSESTPDDSSSELEIPEIPVQTATTTTTTTTTTTSPRSPRSAPVKPPKAGKKKPAPPPKPTPKTSETLNYDKAADYFHTHGSLFGFQGESEAIVKVDFQAEPTHEVVKDPSLSPEEYCKPHGELFGFERKDKVVDMAHLESQILTPRGTPTNSSNGTPTETRGKEQDKPAKPTRNRSKSGGRKEESITKDGKHKSPDGRGRSSSKSSPLETKRKAAKSTPASPRDSRDKPLTNSSETSKRSLPSPPKESKNKKNGEDTKKDKEKEPSDKPKKLPSKSQVPPKPARTTTLDAVLSSSGGASKDNK